MNTIKKAQRLIDVIGGHPASVAKAMLEAKEVIEVIADNGNYSSLAGKAREWLNKHSEGE